MENLSNIPVDETLQYLEKGIRHLVYVLRELGFKTYASCEGHLDHGNPFPWVSLVGTPESWCQKRRPELLRHWIRILGKLAPSQADEKWFGDIRKTVVHTTEEKEGYTRIVLSLPIEKHFLQPHALLLP